MSEPKPESNETESTGDSIISWIPSVASALILGVFLLVMYKMFNLAENASNEGHWTRALYIYNGLEALAFAAAGVLLGERIQRGRADAAETRATNAEERADGATQEAADAKAKGKALKTAVLARVDSSSALESGGEDTAGMDELSALANRLFPD